MRELLVCPICLSEDRKLVYPSTLVSEISHKNIPDPYSAHYQINQCSGCDLRFSSPILDEQGVTALYCQSENGNISDGEFDNVRRTMYNYYDLAKPYIKARDKVLDIGCDVGYFLESALEDNFKEIHGLEPTTPARVIAEKLPNSKISEKFYEAIEYEANYFDLVSMIHVLDHLVDPSIALKKAHHELKIGGLLIAVVHNSKSILGVMMGEKFPVYNLYHHYFFTKSTLRKLLESQGYEVIKVVSTKNCYSIGFFIQKIPLLPSYIKDGMLKLAKCLSIHKITLNLPVGNIGVLAKKVR
ncbi:MAG: class I SAM-dependent methyltransferase [Legionellaceae bacterium]|nr:class I SAM-dependent methyltransferase [Legionellaceae bacterium]